MIECSVGDPYVDGFLCFSGKMFVVLIYYFEVGDDGMRIIVGFTVDIKCTGYMTAMFFQSIL